MDVGGDDSSPGTEPPSVSPGDDEDDGDGEQQRLRAAARAAGEEAAVARGHVGLDVSTVECLALQHFAAWAGYASAGRTGES